MYIVLVHDGKKTPKNKTVIGCRTRCIRCPFSNHVFHIMTPHVISGQIKSKKIASQLDILTMIVLQHDAQMRSISFSTQYLLLVWFNVLCITVLDKKNILLSIFTHVRNGHLDLVFGWCDAKIYKMCSQSVFLRHQCPQEWDAPVPGWHYLDARDRSRRLIAGGASGGDGDGALKIALHCSANSEHCILRRTGGNRCACQWVRRIKPLNFEVGVSD